MSVEVALPGGFEHGGSWRRRVALRPLSGRNQAFLTDELAGARPAARTTALLGRCVTLEPGLPPAGPELVRALTIGDREALLLHLRRAMLGERLSAVATCTACGEKLDLDLEVGSLLLPPYPHEGTLHQAEIEAQGRRYRVTFRLPTGADQEWAAPFAATDAEAAAHGLLERCVRSVEDEAGILLPGLPPAVTEALPDVMAELDPQAEIEIGTTCPACGAGSSTLFDAGQYVCQELLEQGDRLWREVHLLAWHYHWSEREILRLSATQRRRYLRLLSEALSGEAA